MTPAARITAAAAVASAHSRRIVLVVVTFAIALAALATPAFTNSASAATRSARAAHPWAYAMLDMMNGERRAHHLKPLTMNTKLVRSAGFHNVRMAKRNTMSHQLPGEAFFATRISNQGYHWLAAGENVGWNSSCTLTGLKALQTTMYNEKAPNDGHRQNILSRSYTQVGIEVHYDGVHKKIWFTQDFGKPAN